MERSKATPVSPYQALDSTDRGPFSAWAPDQTGVPRPGNARGDTESGLRLADNGGELGAERPGQADNDSQERGDGGGKSAVGGSDLGQALRLAEQLIAALRALEEREKSAYRLDQETMERIRRLEQSAQSVAAVHRALEDRVRVPLGGDELEMLESLLNAWVGRPNDLLVMVKLAERSTVLAQVVAAFREIRRLIDSVGNGAPDE